MSVIINVCCLYEVSVNRGFTGFRSCSCSRGTGIRMLVSRVENARITRYRVFVYGMLFVVLTCRESRMETFKVSRT